MSDPQAAPPPDVSSYTEATHTVYADVAGHPPIDAGGRAFTPRRITVKYHWRTQLGDEGWQIGNIEISGFWLDPDRPGSGMVLLHVGEAPGWAREIAVDNEPSSALVPGFDAYRELAAEVKAIRARMEQRDRQASGDTDDSDADYESMDHYDSNTFDDLEKIAERAAGMADLIPAGAPPVIVIWLDIVNLYGDDDVINTSVADKAIPAPPTMDEDSADYSKWANEHIRQFVGTGRTRGDSWHDVTVTACTDPAMVGRTFEFGY